jgi:hypothetical protein
VAQMAFNLVKRQAASSQQEVDNELPTPLDQAPQ